MDGGDVGKKDLADAPRTSIDARVYALPQMMMTTTFVQQLLRKRQGGSTFFKGEARGVSAQRPEGAYEHCAAWKTRAR